MGTANYTMTRSIKYSQIFLLLTHIGFVLCIIYLTSHHNFGIIMHTRLIIYLYIMLMGVLTETDKRVHILVDSGQYILCIST